MKVQLIKFTGNPDYSAALAARVCYSSLDISEISLSDDDVRKLIKRILKSGHYSVLEHVSFTYALEGISRTATHQLVRHRLASYSQQSHRYTKIKENKFVTPPDIQNNKRADELYQKALKNAVEIYNKLIDMGIKREDARFVIPQGVSSNIMVTMNARELLHFFTLRCCVRAQWEIREAAVEMLKLARKEAPVIFEDAGPSCVRGRCFEEHPCENIQEIREFFEKL